MSDDPTTEALVEAAKVLAKESYDDVAKPSAKVVGEMLASVLRLPAEFVKMIADGGTAGVLRLRATLAKERESIPPERQIAPPANISGLATLHYLMLGDGADTEDLRQMFVKLLRSAMDRDTAADVHPAFVSMIAQLAPAEAWLLQSINRPEYGAVNMFRFVEAGRVALGFRTTLGMDLGIETRRLQQQISNLDRLGILSIEWGSSSTEAEIDAIDKLLAHEFPGGNDTSAHAGVIRVTPLGEQFLDTCVRLPRAK